MMIYKLRITSVAKSETKKSVLYYEEIQESLGLAFLKEIEKAYA